MTRRLVLVRHAKSSWDAPLDDHARPLNRRGRDAAPRIGDWISSRDAIPDEVLCSDATRTRETLDLMLGRWGAAPEVSYLSALYHASPATLLNAIKAASGQKVLLVGHNPGIGALASALVAQAPDHPRFFDYPTCATLIIDFDIDQWPEVPPGGGRAVDFTVPRELG